MTRQSTSIRTFIGAQNFNESRAFYDSLGFVPHAVDDKMIYYAVSDDLGFYLQDYYVKDWVDNSMVVVHLHDPFGDAVCSEYRPGSTWRNGNCESVVVASV